VQKRKKSIEDEKKKMELSNLHDHGKPWRRFNVHGSMEDVQLGGYGGWTSTAMVIKVRPP
jgi:hypothetical protein